MIIQRTLDGERPVVIRNVDHAATAAMLSEHFGNSEFAKAVRHELLTAVTLNHEEGWRVVDDEPPFDPETGLPYHLDATPAPFLIAKSKTSPDFNEQYHPWCGLMSSMHAWGLFNNRYGLSDKVSITTRPAEHRNAIEAMLSDELERQKRLLKALGSDQAAKPPALMTAYKLLEFFDTLALHFQLAGNGLRENTSFVHVPTGHGEDLTLTLEMIAGDTARISPYPFDISPLPLRCRVRKIERCESQSTLHRQLAEASFEEQNYIITGE